MGYKRGSLRYVTSCLAIDDIGRLFVCGDGPLVLRVLSSSVLNGPRDLRGPRVLRSGFYNMPHENGDNKGKPRDDTCMACWMKQTL